jgi:hypothetical protein
VASFNTLSLMCLDSFGNDIKPTIFLIAFRAALLNKSSPLEASASFVDAF